MMSRKGQVVLFILFGILLLFLTSILFYVYATKNSDVSSRAGDSFDAKSVASFVNLCLQEKGVDALVEVAGRGGYFVLPVYSTEPLLGNVPYFFYRGSSLIPTVEQVQENVALAVDKRFGDCLNFSSFQGVEISVQGVPKMVVVFSDEQMQVIVHQKIIVRNGKSETTVESFAASVPTVFLALFEHAKKIVEMHKTSSDYTCLSCLRELNDAATGFTTKTGMSPEGVLYALEEKKKENAKSLVFRFAVIP